jgi:hypothetical protein
LQLLLQALGILSTLCCPEIAAVRNIATRTHWFTSRRQIDSHLYLQAQTPMELQGLLEKHPWQLLFLRGVQQLQRSSKTRAGRKRYGVMKVEDRASLVQSKEDIETWLQIVFLPDWIWRVL